MKYLAQYENHNDDYTYTIIEASSLESAEKLAKIFNKNSYDYKEGVSFRQVILLADVEKIIETITEGEDILRKEYMEDVENES